jgi:peptidylprolyl isomerase
MKMTTVANGSTVTFHYKGTLEDGTQFDSSYDRNEPMTAKTGEGNLIAGFETALEGMTAGDTKIFTVESSEAYGDRNEEATTTLEKSIFPDDFPFDVGMPLPLMGPDGQQVTAMLSEVQETTVTADFNHPLAGKDLTFELELLTVEGTE